MFYIQSQTDHVWYWCYRCKAHVERDNIIHKHGIRICPQCDGKSCLRMLNGKVTNLY